MAVRCNRCNRVLTDPLYVAIGYGAVCAGKEGVTVPPDLVARARKTRLLNRVKGAGGGSRAKQLKGQLTMFDMLGEGGTK